MGEGDWPKSDGDILYASETNVLFNLVPIGVILPWAKHFGQFDSGSATSTSSTKLIDSSATFQTSSISTNMKLMPTSYSDATESVHTSSTYSIRKTLTFGASGDFGLKIPFCTNEIKTGNTSSTCTCKYTFYYTDTTSSDSNENTNATTSYLSKTYTNPYPYKEVWKVEISTKSSNGSTNTYNKSDYFNFNSMLDIVSVDSETQLTLQKDYIKYSAIAYNIIYSVALPDNYLECDGSTISDSESIFNGLTLPNLNGNQNFLYGYINSGTSKNENYVPDHQHGIPVTRYAGRANIEASTSDATDGINYTTDSGTEGTAWAGYSVIMIMRVK